MKLGIISDLHIENHEPLLKSGQTSAGLLAQLANTKGLDGLVVGGDISNNYLKTQAFIEDLDQKMEGEVYYIPGNHDLWTQEGPLPNAWDIHDYFKAQPQSLIENPRLLTDKYALVGSMGWYDYGYADQDKYSLEDFERGKLRFATWKDKDYIAFPESDQEVSRILLDQLEEDLSQVGDRKVILITHMVTHPAFVVPLPHRIYDFFNAYLGARSYEKLYRGKDQILYNIMGHSHFRFRIHSEGVHHLSACLGHPRQWLNRSDLLSELDNTLKVLHLA